MTTFTWNTGSGSFATAGNWTPAGPPGAADTAVFNSGAGTISGADTIATLQLNGGTWTWTGALRANNINANGTETLSTGGSWTLTGTPSNSNYLVIGGGSGGTGSVLVQNGASIGSSQSASTSAYALYVGSGTFSNATGSLTVSGAGSSVNTGQNGATIGEAGTGTLVVQAGATATFTSTDSSVIAALAAGRSGGSNGSVTVTGAGSSVTANGFVYVGRSGQATLTVTAGGVFTGGSAAAGSTPAYGIDIGDSSGSSAATQYFGGSGSATVSGAGTLNSLGDLAVGLSGTTGSLTVSGTGSLAESGTQVVIGGGTVRSGGVGTLTVQGGGTVRSGNPGTGNAGIAIGIGMAGDSGSATVTGAGSLLDANGYRLTVGGASNGISTGGNGSLVISGGGVARSGASYTDTEAALAVGAVAGGSGTISVTGAGSALQVTGLAVLGGNEKNGALTTGGGTGTVSVTSGGAFQASGGVVIQSGSRLTVDGSSTLTTPSITINGGSATLASLTTATAVSFGSGGTLAVGSVTGSNTVGNFSYGDVIDVTGGTATLNGSTLTTATGSIALGAAPSGASYQLVSDGHGGVEVGLTPQTIGIYRFFETTNGTHFYTGSSVEATALVTPGSGDYRPDLTAEANDFGAYQQVSGDSAQEQVFRFFDSGNGTEFLTASASEAAGLTNPNSATYRPDLVQESGSAFYEDSTQQVGDVPVYRFFDTTYGTHFYTASQSEYAGLTTPGSATFRTDLTFEGVTFYAPAGTFAAAAAG